DGGRRTRAAGRRVVDEEQRVLRRLVGEGEVEAATTLQDRRIEAQRDLVARLRLQVRVPVVVRRDEVDRLITHDGDGGTVRPIRRERRRRVACAQIGRAHV